MLLQLDIRKKLMSKTQRKIIKNYRIQVQKLKIVSIIHPRTTPQSLIKFYLKT